jgi:hypothetical protein
MSALTKGKKQATYQKRHIQKKSGKIKIPLKSM